MREVFVAAVGILKNNGEPCARVGTTPSGQPCIVTSAPAVKVGWAVTQAANVEGVDALSILPTSWFGQPNDRYTRAYYKETRF